MPATQLNGRARRPDAELVDLGTETALVGALLLDSTAEDVAARHVRPVDFADPLCRAAYAAIVARRRAGEAIDIGLIGHDMRAAGEDPAAITPFLAAAADAAPTSAHAEYYATIIAGLARKRAALDAVEHARGALLNGAATASTLTELHASAEDLMREGAGPERDRFKVWSGPELAAEDLGLRYLVEGVLVEGQPCIVGGAKKCLKTSALVDLGVSLATGADFLGEFAVHAPRRYLLVSGESGLAVLKETATRCALAKGCELVELADFGLTDDIPPLEDPDAMRLFRARVADYAPEVIALDPAYLAMSGEDAGNVFAQGARLREINSVCVDAGAMLILAHHTAKGVASPYDPPELEHLAWAGFQEFARQWLLLGRREPYVDGSGEHRLWLRVGGSAGHSGLWGVDIDEGTNSALLGRRWDVAVRPAADVREESAERAGDARRRSAEAREAEQLDGDRQRVVDALHALGRPETKTNLADGAAISNARCGRALLSLAADGYVREATIERANGQKYEGYELCPE